MKKKAKITNDIINHIENKEYIANINVMKCFTAAMVVYSITFLLNIFNIFIIELITEHCYFLFLSISTNCETNSISSSFNPVISTFLVSDIPNK